MLGNAQYFLSNTRKECCEKFYEWNYYPCTGTKPDGSGDYYPDWNGSPATCKNDGNMPDYMLNPDNARWYLVSTLKECCERHVHYDLNNCMGSSGTPVAGSDEWYVEYSANTCVQDCTGSSTTCGGLVEGSWVETFSTKKACCDAKLWYYPDCIRTNNQAKSLLSLTEEILSLEFDFEECEDVKFMCTGTDVKVKIKKIEMKRKDYKQISEYHTCVNVRRCRN